MGETWGGELARREAEDFIENCQTIQTRLLT